MKIVLVRRVWFAVGVCVLAAAAILWIVNHPAVAGVSTAARELPIYSVERDHKVCALTFDAAWGNEDTELLIEILGDYDIRATFFVVGAWVEKYAESAEALHAAGHEIMNHSDAHAHMTRLDRNQIIEDLNVCNDKIEAITGVRPTLMRPPYGEYDNTVISAVRSLGMEPIQWDVDSLDWKDLCAEEITKRVISRVGSGSIVLFHNAALHTPEALPGIMKHLIQEGYSFLPVSELILRGNYRIDHTGRQCPAEAGEESKTTLLAGVL